MPFLQKDKEFLDKLYNKVTTDTLELKYSNDKNVSVSILRLDKIHPSISGNKIFKLKYYLEKARETDRKIITFGGAYSNHLAATAAICREWGIVCKGIVRGERPDKLSHTLEYAMTEGMELEFVSREQYDINTMDYPFYLKENGEVILIPEGGYGEEGVRGASEIKKLYQNNYTDIVCAVGTATTMAGLITSSSGENILGISVIKNITDIEMRLQNLLKGKVNACYTLNNAYNFGGYARRNSELICFMNDFYNQYKIPLDFVYTAKMMFGVQQLVENNFFKEGSNILCLHTGGLQGNLSLPSGLLHY